MSDKTLREAAPPIPGHPEPHTYAWTVLEIEAIEGYGKKCFEAGRAAALAVPDEPVAWAAGDWMRAITETELALIPNIGKYYGRRDSCRSMYRIPLYAAPQPPAPVEPAKPPEPAADAITKAAYLKIADDYRRVKDDQFLGADVVTWCEFEAMEIDSIDEQPAPVEPAKPLTTEHIRAAGGIVHGDGNIFFTNIGQMNLAIQGSKE